MQDHLLQTLAGVTPQFFLHVSLQWAASIWAPDELSVPHDEIMQRLERLLERLRPAYFKRQDFVNETMGFVNMPVRLQKLYWRRAALLNAIIDFERTSSRQFHHVLCARPDLFYGLPIARLLGAGHHFMNHWDYAFVTGRRLAAVAMGAFHSLRSHASDQVRKNYIMHRCETPYKFELCLRYFISEQNWRECPYQLDPQNHSSLCSRVTVREVLFANVIRSWSAEVSLGAEACKLCLPVCLSQHCCTGKNLRALSSSAAMLNCTNRALHSHSSTNQVGPTRYVTPPDALTSRTDAMEPSLAPCLHGAPNIAWAHSTVLIVAVFKEWGVPPRPPLWLSAQWPLVLYQRLEPESPCYVPNRGAEAGIYMHFVVNNFERLPAVMVFLQADFLNGFAPAKHDFWQPRCADDLRWQHWMPLSKHQGEWPPRQVTRSPLFWK